MILVFFFKSGGGCPAAHGRAHVQIAFKHHRAGGGVIVFRDRFPMLPLGLNHQLVLVKQKQEFSRDLDGPLHTYRHNG